MSGKIKPENRKISINSTTNSHKIKIYNFLNNVYDYVMINAFFYYLILLKCFS